MRQAAEEGAVATPSVSSPGRLQGRKVVVTGAGSGIGRACALRFAKEGAGYLILVDSSAERLDSVARELALGGTPVHPLRVDLADAVACRSCVEEGTDKMGGLDIVVSNAGTSAVGPILHTALDTWNRILAVNLTASFIIGQAAAEVMLRHGRGGVILFTAASVERGGMGGTTAYDVSKMGVIQLVRGMAAELGAAGVRVNAVSPGFTATEFARDVAGQAAAERLAAEMPPRLAMGRMARPEEIAAVFAFLASDDASYINGGNYWVDGGWLANSPVVAASA